MIRLSPHLLLAAAALLALSTPVIHAQQADSASSRATLTKQKQDALQELDTLATQKKELEEQDWDAERELSRAGPQFSFQKQELQQRRNGIAEALRDNARRQATLSARVKSLDEALRALPEAPQ